MNRTKRASRLYVSRKPEIDREREAYKAEREKRKRKRRK